MSMCPYQRVHLGHRGFAHGYFWVKGLVWPLLWATFSSAIGDSSLCCRSHTDAAQWTVNTLPLLSLYFPHYHIILAGCVRLCRGWGQLKKMSQEGQHLRQYIPAYIHTKTYRQMLIADFCVISNNWKQPKCRLTGKWINKLWYTHIEKKRMS